MQHRKQVRGGQTTDPDMQHVAAADGSSGQHFQVEACEGVQRMGKVGYLCKEQHKLTYAHTKQHNMTYTNTKTYTQITTH